MGVSNFTIEAWFRRDGPGVATATSGGAGGVTAVPILTKGRSEADGSNVDMNYFLGIRSSDGVLAADFEDSATGANHAVAGPLRSLTASGITRQRLSTARPGACTSTACSTRR